MRTEISTNNIVINDIVKVPKNTEIRKRAAQIDVRFTSSQPPAKLGRIIIIDENNNVIMKANFIDAIKVLLIKFSTLAIATPPDRANTHRLKTDRYIGIQAFMNTYRTTIN